MTGALARGARPCPTVTDGIDAAQRQTRTSSVTTAKVQPGRDRRSVHKRSLDVLDGTARSDRVPGFGEGEGCRLCRKAP